MPDAAKQEKQQDPQDTPQPAPAATNVVKIDGKKKGWPDRLDGVEVTFATIPTDATPDDAVAFLRERSDDSTFVAFLRDSLEKRQDAWLRSHLNGKAREPGKSYSREDAKKLPTRSATISKEDAEKLGTHWEIPAPRVSASKAKVSAAEAKARRSEQERDAAIDALVDTLQAMKAENPKKAAEQLESFKAAGLVPAETTL